MTTDQRALALGSRLPDFSLPAPDGQLHTADSLLGSNRFLTIIFLANHCPYVSAWEDRIVAIANEFSNRHVGFAGISSNDVAKHPQDSQERMRRRAREKNYPFPYLYDENGAVAAAFGATRTPEVFVFDADMRLRYHGAVDSDYEESAYMQNYLREALDRLITGQTVSTPETPPVGCIIEAKG